MHWYVRSGDPASRLEPLKARVLAASQAGADAAGCEMDARVARARLRRPARQRAALSTSTPRTPPGSVGRVDDPDAGQRRGGQHRHGQRQLPRAVHPPDDRGRADGRRIHTPEFAVHAGGPAGDAAVLDGAKAMAMTIVDLWLRPSSLDAAAGPPSTGRSR